MFDPVIIIGLVLWSKMFNNNTKSLKFKAIIVNPTKFECNFSNKIISNRDVAILTEQYGVKQKEWHKIK